MLILKNMVKLACNIEHAAATQNPKMPIRKAFVGERSHSNHSSSGKTPTNQAIVIM